MVPSLPPAAPGSRTFKTVTEVSEVLSLPFLASFLFLPHRHCEDRPLRKRQNIEKRSGDAATYQSWGCWCMPAVGGDGVSACVLDVRPAVTLCCRYCRCLFLLGTRRNTTSIPPSDQVCVANYFLPPFKGSGRGCAGGLSREEALYLTPLQTDEHL